MRSEGKSTCFVFVMIAAMFVFSAVPMAALAGTGEVWIEETCAPVVAHLSPVTVVETAPVPEAASADPATPDSPPAPAPSAEVVLDIPVHAGWNLVSFAPTFADPSILTVLDDDGGDTVWTSAQSFVPGSGWKVYTSSAPPMANSLKAVNNGMGVWLDVADTGSDGMLRVRGEAPATTDIQLRAGWNLVGYPSVQDRSVASALAGVPYDLVQCYDAASTYHLRNMLPTDAMSLGNGYWIHLTADSVWSVAFDEAAPSFAGLTSAVDAGTGGAVDLSWSAASDPSAPITYNIYQAGISGGQNFASPTYTTADTSFQAAGLTDGMPYYFVVRAEDSLANEDSNTVERSATPTLPDTTPPQIVSTAPASAATGVAITQQVVITFSEPINTGTFAYTSVPNPGGWSVVWSGGDTVATLSHTSLAYSTTYTFTVTAAQDVAGNALVAGPVPNPWSFTTGAAPDTIPPQVVSNTPANGATGVAVSANIVVVFTEAMNQGNTQGAFSIVPAAAGVFSWNAGGDTMTLNPTADLAYSTLHTVTILTAATDLAGNTLDGDKDGTMEADNKDKWVFSFTTGPAPDTTAPYIVTTTPASAATGVAITQSVVITFSEAINTGTFTYTSVPNPGGWSVAWSGGNTVATLTHTSFAYSTTYAFTVTAAQDIAGNALAAAPVPNPWSFTTMTEPDVTSPYIVTTVPASAATGVAITQSVVITFSEAINTGTFTYTSVPNPGGWSVAWSGGNTVATLTHTSFAYSTTYTFTVTAAQDIAGNALAAGPVPNPWSFTTATAPDVTAPYIVTTTPASAATGVAITQSVVVTFSESINTGTFTYTCVPNPGGWSATWSAATFANDRVTLTHTNFAYGTSYTFTVTAASDLAGNALAAGPVPNPWSFTTATAPDTIPPQVVSNTPSNGATGVAVSANIVVVFTEAMNQGNTQGAWGIVPSVAGAFSWNAGGDTLTFNPTADLAFSTLYTVTILTAATDLAGNTLDGDKDGTMEADNKDKWVFSFTTGTAPDLTGPIVTNVVATPNPVAQGSTLTLTATVSDVTTGNSNVAAGEWSRGTSAAVAGAGTAMSASDGSFNTPTEGVTASISTTGWTGTNTLWVRGRDANNNWGAAVSTTVDVTAPDTIPPQVTTNTPANGATGVLVTVNIVVDFSEAMNQGNTQGAWSIVPSVAGAFSWNAGGDILTFNPTADLVASTTYTVTILTAATDLAGNTLDGDKDGTMEGDVKDKWVFSFTTAGGSISRYAVCVGINKYDYQNDLTYCVNDAGECRTNLLGAGYSVNLLTDGQATKVAILAALNTMGTSEVTGDYTAFTYSGHGGTSGGAYFICPEDCYYIEDMITDDEMNVYFDAYQSVHQLTFFDSCNSGGLNVGGTGRLSIMAAAANQYSWDGQPDIANGVWTYFFWEAGYRNGGAGSTVLETVFVYAKPLASAYVTTNYPGYSMTPQIDDSYTGSFYL